LQVFIDDHYLPYVKSCKRGWVTNVSVLKNHITPEFGMLHMDEVTQSLIVKYHLAMREKGYAAATANRVVVMLRIRSKITSRFGHFAPMAW